MYCKVLEKIIKKNIEIFLIQNKLIKNTQHGFTKGASCLSNLLICQNSIVSLLDEGCSVDIIYLDFQKAFDKVPHDILMIKIRELGIVGKIADWIKNWLEGRSQRVGINGVYSDWNEVTSGVPQGSILGPLLFTIFINDLEAGVRNYMLKFADDSKLWGRVDTEEDRINVQKDLDTLGDWARRNKMPFNVSKCKVMHIGKHNNKYNYWLMDQKITETREEKDLGVFFTDTFKSGTNCDKVSKTANKTIGMIRRNISNKSAEGMLILYKTLVRTVLDYCVQVWRPYKKKDMIKLEKVKKRFTKMIEGYKIKSYEQRLAKLGITTLEGRFHRADMIQVYKILNDKKNIFPTDFLELSSRAGRKNSLKLFKRRSNGDISKYCFASRVVDPWNDLPDAVVLSADVNVFKGNLDRFMRESRGQL